MQQADRIGFVDLIAVAGRLDMEFVERALVYSGNKSFPDAGGSARVRADELRAPQELKLPTTETRRAFGAQTLKMVPACPSRVSRWAPMVSYRR